MTKYYSLVSDELRIKLDQVRQLIRKHNPTIGLLTETIVRSFLATYLPKLVSVEQGFIMNEEGEVSRQCDILIYDSHNYYPLYRIDDVVVVPSAAVVAIIEVKTTITKPIFHSVIDYFKDVAPFSSAQTFLFVYESCPLEKLEDFFTSYEHKGCYPYFDHDTYLSLPNQITGINPSYHLRQDTDVSISDRMGYSSFFWKDQEGTEQGALQLFYESVVKTVFAYSWKIGANDELRMPEVGNTSHLSDYFAFGLFES